jgi:peptidoglycan hydrolase-like protein with peptidoglycan-binding domain
MSIKISQVSFMKTCITASLSHYLSKKQSYCLLLFSATPLLIGVSALVSIAAPVEIAQVGTVANIKRPNIQIGSQGEQVIELQAALKLLGFYTGAVDGVYQQQTAQSVSQFQQAAGLKPNGIVDAFTWQVLFPDVSMVAANTTASVVRTTTLNNPTVTTPVNRNTRVNNTVIPKKPAPKPITTSQNQANIKFQPTPPNQQNPNFQYTASGWPILRLGNRGAEVMKLQKLLQILGFLKSGTDGDFGMATETAVKAAQVRYGLQPDGVVGGATWEAFVRRLPQQR